MFTLQSGQIENALRSGGLKDISAKEMMQGVANCQAPIEHRAPVALTRPVVNYFPNIKQAGPTLRFNEFTRNAIIKIPPWQTVPFTPLPFLPVPPWQTIPYPGWPTTQFDDPTLTVAGPVKAGPVTTPVVNSTTVNTTEIINQGDTVNEGDVRNAGDTINQGDTIHNGGSSTQNTVVNNGPVNHYGTVVNQGDTYVNVLHSQFTENHGPTYNYSETRMDGPNYFNGPNIFRGTTVVNGLPLNRFTLKVVTGATFTAGVLSVATRDITVFGRLGAIGSETVFDCNA